MPVLAGFIGGAYESRSRTLDCQRTVNLYPEVSDSGTSKNVSMLVGTAGLRSITVLNGYVVRGMIVFSETVAIIIAGQYVYKWEPRITPLPYFIGAIALGTGPVSMATNGITVFLADGTTVGYVITPGLNLVMPYTNVSYKFVNKVVFLNGSYIINEVGTGRFWVMDPYSTTMNPLYFATAEGSPDQLITIFAHGAELWLLGSATTEVWANNGDTTTFPYQLIQGTFMQQGIVAKSSIARMDNSLFWLTSNEEGQGMVVRTAGYQTQRVSTHAIEKTFAEYARQFGITDAIAYTYQQEGHSFYVLTFPSANATWVYDVSTKQWHERAYRQGDGSLGRHRSNCHIFFNNNNVVGDWETGRIYTMDLDAYDDAGNPLIRIRVSPHVTQELTNTAYHRLQIDMDTGEGLLEGQGSNPVGMLRWSDDGGKTWSNIRETSLGALGNRNIRALFTRLGSARDRVFEFSVADPIKVCLVGAIINGG